MTWNRLDKPSFDWSFSAGTAPASLSEIHQDTSPFATDEQFAQQPGVNAVVQSGKLGPGRLGGRLVRVRAGCRTRLGRAGRAGAVRGAGLVVRRGFRFGLLGFARVVADECAEQFAAAEADLFLELRCVV